ncbi:PIN domain-containing protein [Psychrobacter celer]|uniref:PIN domain-containing protein n=1 Tax=Psychrobacter celer TaxID=306572 RepID=UPI003FD6247B
MKHILIDYENIQPKSFEGIDTKECHVWLFLGIHQQKSLPLGLVEALLAFNSDNVHIIKMQHAGKNALDFYLSFYLGKISEIDAQADVCILARDSGYDILVEHLNTVYDGMAITRAGDANQLSLAYEVENTIEADIEQTQLIVDTSQNEVFYDDTNSDGLIDTKTATVPISEEKTPQSIIHDCYVLVFDSIVNRKMFLPSYKSNLLSAMKKYALAEALVKFDEAEQNNIVEKVFDKFIKKGLIELDSKNEKLCYNTDSQGVLNLVAEKVLLSKAKTMTGLINVIKQKLASYRQKNDESQVNLVITWLKNQGLIKQNNQKVCYPTLDDLSVHKTKTSVKNVSSKTIDQRTVYQCAIASIKARPVSSRPAKKSSLINYLNSHLRDEDPKTIDNIVKQMIGNQVVMISSNNKLSYNI